MFFRTALETPEMGTKISYVSGWLRDKDVRKRRDFCVLE
jgi:hypothetical protein